MSTKFLLEESDPHINAGEQKRLDYVQQYIRRPNVEDDIYKDDDVLLVLDKALSTALKQKRKASKKEQGIKTGPYTSPNVLIIGPAGCGKTERVKDWAEDRHVHLVVKNIQTFAKDTMGSVTAVDQVEKQAITVATKEFDGIDNIPQDELDDGCIGTVLFLDEFNMANRGVRGTLQTFIRDHKFDKVENSKEFKKLLFVVACQNPSGDESGSSSFETHSLTPAEKDRFPFRLFVTASKPATLRHLTKAYTNEYNAADDEDEKADARRKLIAAQCMLSKKGPKFDDNEDVETKMDASQGQEDPYSPRSLTDMLEITDGYPDEIQKYFLDKFGYGEANALTSAVAEMERMIAGDPEITSSGSKGEQTFSGDPDKYRKQAELDDAAAREAEAEAELASAAEEDEEDADEDDFDINPNDFTI